MSLRDALAMLVLAALWGGSFLLMRLAAPEFGPVPLVAVRTGVAALCLLPLLFLARGMQPLLHHWRALFVLGVVGTAVPFSLLSYSTLFLSAGYASILNATTPMFGALVSYFWLKDKLSMSGLVGLLLGFFGVFVLVLDKGGVGGETLVWPIVTALIATCLYGVGATYTKVRFGGIEPLALATGCQLASALFLLPGALYWWPTQTPSANAWLAAGILGVACTGIAFILFFRLIRDIGPANTMTVAYLIPVFGIGWGWLLLDEQLTMPMLLGGGLILFGVSLTTGLLSLRRKAASRVLAPDS